MLQTMLKQGRARRGWWLPTLLRLKSILFSWEREREGEGIGIEYTVPQALQSNCNSRVYSAPLDGLLGFGSLPKLKITTFTRVHS